LRLWPREINFRRILRQNDDRLLGDSSSRRFLMRLQNVLKRGFAVVEQAIRGLHLSPSAAGRGKAGGRMCRELREHFPQAVVQSIVLEIRRLHFINNPWGQHRQSFDLLLPLALTHFVAIIPQHAYSTNPNAEMCGTTRVVETPRWGQASGLPRRASVSLADDGQNRVAILCGVFRRRNEQSGAR
jgi:hypothetical protein